MAKLSRVVRQNVENRHNPVRWVFDRASERTSTARQRSAHRCVPLRFCQSCLQSPKRRLATEAGGRTGQGPCAVAIIQRSPISHADARNEFGRLAGIGEVERGRKPSEPPRQRDPKEHLQLGREHDVAVRCIEIAVGILICLPGEVAERRAVIACNERCAACTMHLPARPALISADRVSEGSSSRAVAATAGLPCSRRRSSNSPPRRER